MQSDTPHFARIAQRAPLALVLRFLEQIDPDFAQTVDWQQADKVLRKRLTQAAHHEIDSNHRTRDAGASKHPARESSQAFFICVLNQHGWLGFRDCPVARKQ